MTQCHKKQIVFELLICDEGQIMKGQMCSADLDLSYVATAAFPKERIQNKFFNFHGMPICD